MTILIPVLGDQLTHDLASLRDVDRRDAVLLMMEVADETTYVRHHKRKIALILSAMRHFAEELRVDGWTVDYVQLDDPSNTGSFSGEVARAVVDAVRAKSPIEKLLLMPRRRHRLEARPLGQPPPHHHARRDAVIARL